MNFLLIFFIDVAVGYNNSWGAVIFTILYPSWPDFNLIKIWSWMGFIVHIKWTNQIKPMPKLVQPILSQFEPIFESALGLILGVINS